MSGAKIVVRIADDEGHVEVQDRGLKASITVGTIGGEAFRFIADKSEIEVFLLAAQLLLGNVGEHVEEEAAAS